MVTYNTLAKDLKGKLDELTPDEVMSILDSIIKNLYDSKNNLDVEGIDKHSQELIETTDVLNGKFNNLETYTLRRQLYYESSLFQLESIRLNYSKLKNDVEAYIYLFSKLEHSYRYLRRILSIYYTNYSNYGYLTDLFGELTLKHNLPITFLIEDSFTFSNKYGLNKELMKELDGLISLIRDDMLETMKRIESKHYVPKEHREGIDACSSIIRNNIHSYLKDEFYDYSREHGLIELSMAFIPMSKLSYELHEAYDKLKMEIGEMFEGDNGFIHLNNLVLELVLERNPNRDIEEEMKNHPKYNIMESKFIPKKNDICESIYGVWECKSPCHFMIGKNDFYFGDYYLDENIAEE